MAFCCPGCGRGSCIPWERRLVAPRRTGGAVSPEERRQVIRRSCSQLGSECSANTALSSAMVGTHEAHLCHLQNWRGDVVRLNSGVSGGRLAEGAHKLTGHGRAAARLNRGALIAKNWRLM